MNNNFLIFEEQFFKNNNSAKGLRLLKSFIVKKDDKGLERLLRNHKKNPIETDQEVTKRDYVDALLDYYSLIEIGIIAGYFAHPIPEQWQEEIRLILSNKYVRKYYEKYYPLYLPQLLIKNIERENYYEPIKIGDKVDSILFEKFIILNNSIRNDKEVNQFLWFLDDGITDYYSIIDFLMYLKTGKHDKGANKIKNSLNMALWGFLKYSQFLIDYFKLLEQCKCNSKLQSAFWHYQSYWLLQIKGKFGRTVLKALRLIKKNYSKNYRNYLKNIGYNSTNEYMEFQNYDENIKALDSNENAIMNLLYGEYGNFIKYSVKIEDLLIKEKNNRFDNEKDRHMNNSSNKKGGKNSVTERKKTKKTRKWIKAGKQKKIKVTLTKRLNPGNSRISKMHKRSVKEIKVA